jgi:hypothetical protein
MLMLLVSISGSRGAMRPPHSLMRGALVATLQPVKTTSRANSRAVDLILCSADLIPCSGELIPCSAD